MLTQREARLIEALRARSGRERHGAFLAEGVRAIEDLLDSGIDLKFAIAAPSLGDTERGRAVADTLAARTGLRRVSEAELVALAETETPQGVLVVAHMPHRRLAELEIGLEARALVLDGVQDPGNVGTLIRTAEAFASSCVIALPGTVDYWNSKVVRSSAGAAFRMPLLAAPAEDVWAWLAGNQFSILGADMTGQPPETAATAARSALVVGNEGAGLRAETRAHIDAFVAVPMPGRAESLNVAVAAGILLYQLCRSR